MKILDGKWEDEYLDYALLEGTYRIKVSHWWSLAPIDELYYSPKRDWRLVLNYFKEFGLIQVLRKIRSRNKEALRNKKFLAVGVGQVLDSGTGSVPLQGRCVAFLAP